MMQADHTAEEFKKIRRNFISESYDLIDKKSFHFLLKNLKKTINSLKKLKLGQETFFLFDQPYVRLFSSLKKFTLEDYKKACLILLEYCCETGLFFENLAVVDEQAKFENIIKWYGSAFEVYQQVKRSLTEDSLLLFDESIGRIYKNITGLLDKRFHDACLAVLQKQFARGLDAEGPLQEKFVNFLIKLLQNYGGFIEDTGKFPDAKIISYLTQYFISLLSSLSEKNSFSEVALQELLLTFDKLKKANALPILLEIVKELNISIFQTPVQNEGYESTIFKKYFDEIKVISFVPKERFITLKADWIHRWESLINQHNLLKIKKITQDEYRANLVKLLQDIAKEVEDLLGPSPTAFVVIILGSVARGDASAFSDIELVLMLFDESYQKDLYFETYIALIINYLDTLTYRCWAQSRKNDLQDFIAVKVGHSFDSTFACFNGLAPQNLAKEVEKILFVSNSIIPEKQNSSNVQQVIHQAKSRPFLQGFGLLQASLLYQSQQLPWDNSSSIDLFKEYKQALNASEGFNLTPFFLAFSEKMKITKDKLGLFSIKSDYLIPLIILNCTILTALKGLDACCLMPEENLAVVLKKLQQDSAHCFLHVDFIEDLLISWEKIRTWRSNLHLLQAETSVMKTKDLLVGKVAAAEVKEYFPMEGRFLNHYWKALTEIGEPDAYTILQWIHDGVLKLCYQYQEVLFQALISKKTEAFDILEVLIADVIEYSKIKSQLDEETQNKLLTYVNALCQRCQRSEESAVRALDKLGKVYRQLPDNYRCYLWDCVLGCKARYPEFYQQVYKILKQIINNDGWRVSIAAREYEWWEKLQKLLIAVPLDEQANQREVLVHLYDLDFLLQRPLPFSEEPYPVKVYRFHPSYYQEIFDQQGYPRLDNEIKSVRHTVLPKNCHSQFPFCLKLLPENMPAEQLGFYLDAFLGGEGLPCGMPIKLQWRQHLFAAHLMEDVRYTLHDEPILSLWETLKTYPQRLKYLDKCSFTHTLQRVLLTNPEDDKGDDYFLIPHQASQTDNNVITYKIKRVDNERLFHTVQDKEKKPLVKTLLYFLNQMSENDSLEIEELKASMQVSAIAMLTHISKKIKQDQRYLQILFVGSSNNQLDEVLTHFNSVKEKCALWGLRKDIDFCLLTHLYTEARLKEIHTRLDLIQGLVQLIINYKLDNPALLLLEATQPSLADYYKPYLIDKKIGYQTDKPELALTRFEAFDQDYQLYQKVNGHSVSRQTGLKAFAQTSGILEVEATASTVRAAWLNGVNSAAQFQAYFEAVQQKGAPLFGSMINAMLKGENLAEDDITVLDYRQQLLLFRALELAIDKFNLQAKGRQLKLFGKNIRFQRLYLHSFRAILTSSRLNQLIDKTEAYLELLELPGFGDISLKTIRRILQCPKLKTLRLKHIVSVRWSDNVSFIQSIKPWNLRLKACKNLNELEIIDCNGVNKLTINLSSSLKLLRIKNCQELKQLELIGKGVIVFCDLSGSLGAIEDLIDMLNNLSGNNISILQIDENAILKNIILAQALLVYQGKKNLEKRTLFAVFQVLFFNLEFSSFWYKLSSESEKIIIEELSLLNNSILVMFVRGSLSQRKVVFGKIIDMKKFFQTQNKDMSLFDKNYPFIIEKLIKILQSEDEAQWQWAFDSLMQIKNDLEKDGKPIGLISQNYRTIVARLVEIVCSEHERQWLWTFDSLMQLKKDFEGNNGEVRLVTQYYSVLIEKLIKILDSISERRWQWAFDSLIYLRDDLKKDNQSFKLVVQHYSVIIEKLASVLQSDDEGQRQNVCDRLIKLKRDIEKEGGDASVIVAIYPLMATSLGKNLQIDNKWQYRLAYHTLMSIRDDLKLAKQDINCVRQYYDAITERLIKILQSEDELQWQWAFDGLMNIKKDLQQLEPAMLARMCDLMVATMHKILQSDRKNNKHNQVIFDGLMLLGEDFIREKQPVINVTRYYNSIIEILGKHLLLENKNQQQWLSNSLIKLKERLKKEKIDVSLIEINFLMKKLQSSSGIEGSGNFNAIMQLKNDLKKDDLISNFTDFYYQSLITLLSIKLKYIDQIQQQWVFDALLNVKRGLQEENRSEELIESLYNNISEVLHDQFIAKIKFSLGCRVIFEKMLTLRAVMQQEGRVMVLIGNLIDSNYEPLIKMEVENLYNRLQSNKKLEWKKILAELSELNEQLDDPNQFYLNPLINFRLHIVRELSKRDLGREIEGIGDLVKKISKKLLDMKFEQTNKKKPELSWSQKGPQLFQPDHIEAEKTENFSLPSQAKKQKEELFDVTVIKQ